MHKTFLMAKKLILHVRTPRASKALTCCLVLEHQLEIE